MKPLLFLCITVSLFSCISQRKCAERYPPEVSVKDSIVEKEVITYRDTTITVPGDTVRVSDSIPCPDVVYKKKAVSKSGRTAVEVEIKNGKLNVDCKTDSLQHVIDSLATVTKSKQHFQTKTITHKVPVPVIKKVVPKWCWYLLAFNIAFFGWKYRGLIVSGATKLLNIIKKIV